MKKSTLIILSFIVVVALCSFQILNQHQSCLGIMVNPGSPSTQNSGGIDGASGSPIDITHFGGTGYCADCHGASSTGVSLAINAPDLAGGYTPGQTYTMNVSISKALINLYGFNFEAQTTANANAGTFVITDPTHIQLFTSLGTNNLSHKTGCTGTGGFTFNFSWTAPATAVGTIKFYAAGIAANANGNDTGDFTSHTSMTISPAAISGISINTNDNSLKVYPNPAMDMFTLKLNQNINEGAVIKLFSNNGKEIQGISVMNSYENTLDVKLPEGLAEGIYFVKVYSKNKVLTEKIIIR